MALRCCAGRQRGGGGGSAIKIACRGVFWVTVLCLVESTHERPPDTTSTRHDSANRPMQLRAMNRHFRALPVVPNFNGLSSRFATNPLPPFDPRLGPIPHLHPSAIPPRSFQSTTTPPTHSDKRYTAFFSSTRASGGECRLDSLVDWSLESGWPGCVGWGHVWEGSFIVQTVREAVKLVLCRPYQTTKGR